MARAEQQAVSLEGAASLDWRSAFAADLRQYLSTVAPALDRRQRTRAAAKTLSDVGRDERLAYDRFHSRLRAERDGGWPIQFKGQSR